MTRKRQSSNSNARVARRRQALHILATLVVVMGAAHVLEKLTGAASLLSKSMHTTMVPSKQDWIQKSRQAPIVMHLLDAGNKKEAWLMDTFHGNKTRNVEPTLLKSRHNDPQAPLSQYDWNSRNDDNANCRIVHEWQRPSHSPYSCNLLHEAVMDDARHLHLLDCGGDRCAYRVKQENGHDDIVLKLPK